MKLILFILPLLVAFPTNQSKTLKKGDRWNIGCMDIDVSVVEIKVATAYKNPTISTEIG